MAQSEVPFVAALFHLKMRWDKDDPHGFEPRVLQGTAELPRASSRAVAAFLAAPPPAASLPGDLEMRMLNMLFESSPLGTKLAWQGFVLFGAKRTDEAARCAFEVLKASPNHLMARQLLAVLLAKTDVRKPFGAQVADAPDVAGIVRREVDTE